ncbi:MAG: hypothetical protein ABIS01_00800, partial [Ferruginibacter sp.]
MKQVLLAYCLCLYFILSGPLNVLQAQEECVLQPPVLKIDFGSNREPMATSFLSRASYHEVNDNCPQDGSYTVVTATGGCFGGHWVTLNEDHTPNDYDGKMLLVNASYNPGLFFVAPLRGLNPGATYQIAAWIVNVCIPRYDCTNLMPNLRFTIENIGGIQLAKFATGDIPATGTATWLQYTAFFKAPADGATIFLKIENKEEGGCGNDFAMDDITV